MGDRTRRLAAAVCCAIVGSLPLTAPASITLTVVDRENKPVPEVVVYAKRVDSRAAPAAAGDAEAPSVTINQRDLAFDPHISVVETGTRIRFPNSDEVRHHVYSFSDAHRFNLTIDSGRVHDEPLEFDTAGIVTLGCNIHDNMLAYVFVVDTPHFSMTGADGTATLALPAGRYEVSVWTPRLPVKSLPEPQVVDVGHDLEETITRRLEDRLYPPHENSKTSLLWDSY